MCPNGYESVKALQQCDGKRATVEVQILEGSGGGVGNIISELK